MRVIPSDISVIVQGPVDWSADEWTTEGFTLSAIDQLKRHLPGAEIILSTWRGEKLDGIDIDKLVFSEDPGAQAAWPSFTPNNVNRQIRSTSEGLKIATRKYSLKIRTDMILLGTKFIDLYNDNCLKIIDGGCGLFTQKILTNNLSSRNTASILERLSGHPLPFHASDHFQLGLTADLLTLWDLPLQNDEDAWFFLDRSYPNRWRMNELSRLAPEQYILTSAIQKKFPFNIRHYADCGADVIEFSEHIMTSHFFTVPDLICPLRFPKYHTNHHFQFEWMRRNDLLKKTM